MKNLELSDGTDTARSRHLLHQKEVARLLDGLGDVTLLERGETGDAAGKDLAGVGHKAGKNLNVGGRELERVLLAWFLGCHKRPKEGTHSVHGKKKVGWLGWGVLS